MKFADIIGQDEVKKTLINAVQTNHLAHALLFRADEGGAALSLGVAFSNYLLCPNRSKEDACGQCDSCVKTSKFIHPDLHFILPYKSLTEKEDDQGKAEMLAQWRSILVENPWVTLHDWSHFAGIESKQISISVKESRRILYNVALKPFEAEKKVIFIWLPELLGTEAANALLKVLEEPNARTQFILVAQDYEKILATILSRTQLVSIRRFTEKEVVNNLILKLEMEVEKAVQIARLAEGNLNLAFKLSSDIPDNNFLKFRDWFRLCYAHKMVELVQWADDFQAMGKEPQKGLLKFGLDILREALIWNYGDETLVKLTEEEKEFMKNFSKIINAPKVEQISNWINESYYQLERNINPKIVFLDLSIKIGKTIKS